MGERHPSTPSPFKQAVSPDRKVFPWQTSALGQHSPVLFDASTPPREHRQTPARRLEAHREAAGRRPSLARGQTRPRAQRCKARRRQAEPGRPGPWPQAREKSGETLRAGAEGARAARCMRGEGERSGRPLRAGAAGERGRRDSLDGGEEPGGHDCGRGGGLGRAPRGPSGAGHVVGGGQRAPAVPAPAPAPAPCAARSPRRLPWQPGRRRGGHAAAQGDAVAAGRRGRPRAQVGRAPPAGLAGVRASRRAGSSRSAPPRASLW